jgi:hypothetical protein
MQLLLDNRCIVNARHTVGNYLGISEPMQRSMMRTVDACIESYGGHFGHLL